MPRLKRDWVGRWVRLRRDVTTKGGNIMLEGRVMQVRRNFGGLNLDAVETCDHCGLGLRHYVTKVSEDSVWLLGEDFDPKVKGYYRKPGG